MNCGKLAVGFLALSLIVFVVDRILPEKPLLG